MERLRFISLVHIGYADRMRRRRLALRQIEEPRPDVSDLEDDDEEEERGLPTFILLATAKAPAVRADHAGVGGDGGTTQLMSSRANVTKPKESALKVDGKPAIFQLYQDGFTPDQVLQLAYVRRRVSVMA